jgi:hypothetical protein
MQVLTECVAQINPKVCIDKWTSSFFIYSPGESKESGSESLLKMEKPFEWNIEYNMKDVMESLKEVNSFNALDELKRFEEDNLWADLKLPVSREDTSMIFCSAVESHRHEGNRALKFTKGDQIRLTKIPSSSDQTWYGELLASGPPISSGWFPKRCVSVNLPSLDMNFTHCMYLPLGISYFTEYLKVEHSEEHIIFWTVANNFFNNPSSEQAKTICETFIALNAPHQINVEFSIRDRIIQEMNCGRYSKDLFTQAQNEVFQVLKNDTYPRFKQSLAYKIFIQEYSKIISPLTIELDSN